MLALRYHTIGNLAALRADDIAVPQAAAGEVLVRIGAASVNPVDWKIASGQFRLLVRGGLPRTMGSDFAGEVVRSGRGVAGFEPGDRVFGCIDPFSRPGGTFAEFAAIPAERVFRIPASLPFTEAAALACVGATAVTLCDLAKVGPGSQVLVTGASGGVGHVTVQVARARGATVTATASASHRDFVLGLGAHACIDYRAEPMETWPRGFDAVLDCVPSIPRRLHRTLLVRGGHYVTTLPGPATILLDPLLNLSGRVRRHGVLLKPTPAMMQEFLDYTTQGRLRCEIEQCFALSDAAAAIARSRSGRVLGKLVLRGTCERSP
jgi:NADPH:quinone reductase-like Zn-dependent oxidoreductase